MRGFTSFAGALLAAAPEAHQAVLLAGIGALASELAWFQDKATARGLGDLDAVGEPAWARDERARTAGRQAVGCTL